MSEIDHTGVLGRAAERMDRVVGKRCEFERGVKLITRIKRLDRALPWFRRFLRERVKSEKELIALLASCRENGFTPIQLGRLRRDFREWHRTEISRQASQSARKRTAARK